MSTTLFAHPKIAKKSNLWDAKISVIEGCAKETQEPNINSLERNRSFKLLASIMSVK